MGRDHPFRDINRPVPPAANVVILGQPKDPMEPLGILVSEIVDEVIRQESDGVHIRQTIISGIAAQVRLLLIIDKNEQEATHE